MLWFGGALVLLDLGVLLTKAYFSKVEFHLLQINMQNCWPCKECNIIYFYVKNKDFLEARNIYSA